MAGTYTSVTLSVPVTGEKADILTLLADQRALLKVTARGLTAAFVVSGVVHLVRPETFEPLVPRALPAHTEIIKGSGVAELVCAAGMLHPRTRRAGHESEKKEATIHEV